MSSLSAEKSSILKKFDEVKEISIKKEEELNKLHQNFHDHCNTCGREIADLICDVETLSKRLDDELSSKMDTELQLESMKNIISQLTFGKFNIYFFIFLNNCF